MKFFTFLGLLLLSTVATAQTTQLKAADCGSTLTAFGDIFSVDGVANATAYEFTFEDQATSVTTVFVRNYHTMTLALAGLLDVGATYDVTIRAEVGGVFGATGPVCALSAPVAVPLTELEGPSCGITLPSFTAPIYCTNVQGYDSFDFEFTNTATSVVTVSNSPWKWNNLALAGLFDVGQSYNVRVRAIVNGVVGAYSTVCAVTAPATVPLTELRTIDCGGTLTTFDQTFKCNAVATAVEYEFEFDDAGTITTVVSPFTSMKLTTAGLFDINTTYDVRVRAKIGSSFGAFGPVCQLSSPAIIPFTQLQASDCGSVLGAYSQIFKADAVAGATMYEFEFTDVATNVVTTATNATRGMTLAAANLQIPNAEYDVKVRTTVGGTVSAYGAACTIFAPATVPLTQVSAADCGLQTTALTDVFSADAVITATEYEWQFTEIAPGVASPPVFTNTVVGSVDNDFTTAGITDNNKSYNVKVRAKVGGVFGNFGLPCIISTPITIPLVQLNAASCGATMNLYTQVFGSTGAAGATQYEFEFTDVTIPGNPAPTVTTQLRGHWTNSLSLAGLIEVGKTYDVRVRAMVGGSFGNFGPTCTLLSPPTVPGSQIRAIHCGSTLTNFSSLIYADGVTGADEYEFRYTNTSTLAQFTHLRNYWNSNLNLAGITDVNTTFDVDVRVRVGTDWSPFGAVCSVTSPAVFSIGVNNNGSGNNATKSGIVNNNGSSILEDAVSIYPNPANNFVNIQTNVSEYNAVVYDLNGKIVYSANGLNGLTTVNLEAIADGLYVVMITDLTGNVLQTEKISVVK